MAFSIALVGKLKHGKLFDALSSRGLTGADLARALQTTPSQAGNILNLQHCPGPKWWAEKDREKSLLDLCGLLVEDICDEFPVVHRTKQQFAVYKEIAPDQVAWLTEGPETPEQKMLAAEERKIINYAIDQLTPRQALVIRARFGLTKDGREQTLEEVAQALAVTAPRARQIETRALRRLGHPSKVIRHYIKNRRMKDEWADYLREQDER